MNIKTKNLFILSNFIHLSHFNGEEPNLIIKVKIKLIKVIKY